MVDMDALFRTWIVQELQLRLAPDLRVDADEDIWLDEGRALAVQPDLVVRQDGRVVLVADASYSLGADGYLAARDHLALVAYLSAMGLGTGLLVHCNLDGSSESEVIVRYAGTWNLGRTIRLDGPYAAVSRSLDVLAELVRDLARQPQASQHHRLVPAW
jgi:5-methylcytosine-specific restriction enzyme subunit McrC